MTQDSPGFGGEVLCMRTAGHAYANDLSGHRRSAYYYNNERRDNGVEFVWPPI